MRHQQAEESYRRRLRADQVDLPDLIAGMKLYPDSAGLTAEALANQGKSAVEALPALRQALEDSLQRTMTLNLPVSELSAASRTRDTLADAIQRISPDQPKAYFTTRDLGAVFAAFKSYSDQADQGQLRQIMTVVHPIMKEGPRIQQGLSPDQMRRLLQAVQSIDADAADVMARQVRRIDAHFVAGHP
ncbi:MAG TPA: hypothetical protein VMF06_19255 [Candidatus Limnocylindria bacterium]|jgi:hypothetical protein|nr:hypothetical protein [Candidatus Limnocylindria bacterium]